MYKPNCCLKMTLGILLSQARCTNWIALKDFLRGTCIQMCYRNGPLWLDISFSGHASSRCSCMPASVAASSLEHGSSPDRISSCNWNKRYTIWLGTAIDKSTPSHRFTASHNCDTYTKYTQENLQKWKQQTKQNRPVVFLRPVFSVKELRICHGPG